MLLDVIEADYRAISASCRKLDFCLGSCLTRIGTSYPSRIPAFDLAAPKHSKHTAAQACRVAAFYCAAGCGPNTIPPGGNKARSPRCAGCS